MVALATNGKGLAKCGIETKILKLKKILL